MPYWLMPAAVGLTAFVAATWALTELADTLGVPLWHDHSYFDSYGDYQEGGSTRAGFLASILSFGVAGWAAGLVHTKRLDCGMSARDWQFAAAICGGLASYVAIMHLLTVTFAHETRGMPGVFFNILDVAVLIGCGYAAFLLLRRRQ